jgi:hypothetical protein
MGSPRPSSPQIQTDKDGYLAGESIQITGTGFSPSDRVTLQVAHDDGTAEAAAGHDRFFVNTDASGSFQTGWSIDLQDTAGLRFLVSAESASGVSDQTAFTRIGSISAARGEANAAHLIAGGFNAGEVVSIRVSGGDDHSPQRRLSDENGTVVTDVDLPPDQANAAMLHITARADESGLVLRVSLSDYAITSRKPNGVPLLEEVHASMSLSEIGHAKRNGSEDIFMTWSTESWNRHGHTRNACALFDTDSDHAVDLAVCGQIQSRSDDAGVVVQASSSPSLFTCDNAETDRCGSPARYGTPAQLRALVKSGTLNTLERDENLSGGRGVSSATLRIIIDSALLPHGATLTSVCSYAAGAGSRPMDCLAPSDGDALSAAIDGTVTATAVSPALAGRVVYHSYASYNDGTSQLFELNLTTGILKTLSSGWTNLKDPMNAHWSPDGTKIVFMARPKKGGNYSAWYDVFLYTFGKSGGPVNLTKTASRHDEDPKFSPDGSRIVYKVRPSTLVEMDLGGNIRNTIVSSPDQDRSMPYYSADATAVWFANRPIGGSASSTSIHRINLDGSNEIVVVDAPGVVECYPVRDTVGQFLYARTASSTSLFDQIYLFDGTQSVSLPFNTPDADYSDAFPIGTQYIVLSSTRAGGRGGYDLYIADRAMGTLWPLSGYNSAVNTPREELGAAYTSN